MTLKKDIEILTQQAEPKPNYRNPDLIKALKIGIEALKVLQHGRLSGSHHDPVLLPGETKD